MKEKLEGAVWGAFLADSLALGAHWIYDTAVIDREFGRVEALMKPLPGSYHPNREAGDFTHYGDQILWLLESLKKGEGFDLAAFSKRWQEGMENYTGYVDGATRSTLANFAQGAGPEKSGSNSDDLSAAVRIAPICLVHQGDGDGLEAAARAQAAMTHNNAKVLDGAAFLARVLGAVLEGAAPVAAVEAALEGPFAGEPWEGWVKEGLASAGEDTRKAIARFGPMCRLDAGFPGVIHLLARYQEDYREANIENVMAGGDSAARGIAAGMILGAHLGRKALPEAWMASLSAGDRISALVGGLI